MNKVFLVKFILVNFLFLFTNQLNSQLIPLDNLSEFSFNFHYGTNHASSSNYDKTQQAYNYGFTVDIYTKEEKVGVLTGFERFKIYSQDSLGRQYGKFTSFANRISYNPIPNLLPIYFNIGLALTVLGENTYDCLFGPQLIQVNWLYGFEVRKLKFGLAHLAVGFQYTPLDIDPSRFGNIGVSTIYLKVGINTKDEKQELMRKF